MDYKVLATTFVTIFLAELGDKTQLGVFALASSGGSRWPVFLGACLALCASTAIATLAAEGVVGYLSPTLIQRAAGVLFIVLGVATLVRS